MTIVSNGKKATIQDGEQAERQAENGYVSIQAGRSNCGFSTAFAQWLCSSAQRMSSAIRRCGLVRLALMVVAPLALAGCTAGTGASLVAGTADPQPGDITRMSFASDTIHLVPPTGFCIDPRMTGHRAEGGFAIVVPCSSLRPGPSGRNRALITVAVGPAGPADEALTSADLLKNAPGARLLTERNDMMLPLVKLNMPDHRARGASPVHWRGAFVLNDQLVALALYAPGGSRNLGGRGARLLNELTAKTLEASVTADLPPSPDAPAQ
ncbi:hypothetical protein PhaeoP18_00075 [Phaeobacter piscinae]|uniref:Uncharacterized protein n=3 Tax=Phaeobacter piscinae TaxID=1580596 RepID=A0AAN1L930_9RHOB|nr:hypothetical protein PhaeoP13_00075 [Phaeobacter piscinae]AUR34379.1 hypothetical protein PhaeoP18_00075 [Phaeobacter piscinae]